MNCLNMCLLLIILTLIKVARSAIPSPCPDVFEYRYDSADNLYGFVQVLKPNDNGNVILLDIQLSVANSVQGFSGKISLASPRSRVIDEILHHKPLKYNVYFPYWINIPPKITQILINGNQVCVGYPVKKNTAPVITTINLQHTLTISLPGNSGHLPDLSLPDNDPKQQTSYYFINSPKNPHVAIDFNPTPPKDPTKIYNKRPSINNNNKHTGWQNHQHHHHHEQFHPRPDFPDRDTSDYDDDNFFSNSPSHHPMVPNKFEPENHKATQTPKPVPQIPTTQQPKLPPIEDLPTVESNLVQKPFSNICGISVNSNALLVNGNRVAKGVHPWLAAVFLQNNEGLKFTCGATLVSQKHVITAGHCVRNRSKKYRPEELWIVLGRENIQRWSNDGAQIIQAQITHLHHDYQFKTADADIAIIVLSEDAVFTTLVRPACLWSGKNDAKLIVEKKGTIIGWGKDESGQIFSPEPRQLSFPVVSEEDCLRSNIGFREITSNRTFCAGYRNNSGPCNGDSGSGFLMQINGRWTLRGVVSMSLLGADGNCDLTQYIVFTDVAKFSDWLLSFLN